MTDKSFSNPPSSSYSEWNVLFVTTLTSVATIIGSGILALPVTLYDTTVPVFLVIFTVSLIAQLGTVYATVEVIQRSRAISKTCQSTSDNPLQTVYQSTSSSSSSADENQGDRDIENAMQQLKPVYDISLFTTAKLYLPNLLLRIIFHMFSIFSLIAILVSYGLAGPQALWQLIGPRSSTTVDPPLIVFLLYVGIGTLSVIFFLSQLLPFFSSLTIVKGILFVLVVLLVALLPESAKIANLGDLFTESQKNYSSAVVAFLMTTIALGGLAVTIPVTYRLLPEYPSKKQIRNYRYAVSTGLLLCYLLNIGWVIAILQVVPRYISDNNSTNNLEYAFENGQITTIPLIEVLRSTSLVSSQLLHSVEIIVQLFIIISTIVSFFVMAAGYKNYMDGFAISIYNNLNIENNSNSNNNNSIFIYFLTYLVAFGPIFAIVLSNPKGFITVLTRFSATALNIQAGVMIFIMLYFSRLQIPSSSSSSNQIINDNESLKNPNNNQIINDIPLPLSNKLVTVLVYGGSAFFITASFLAALGPLIGINLTVSE